MQKTDRCIVRNEAYQKKSVSIRERHNERKNQGYSNPDIVTERSHLNVLSKPATAVMPKPSIKCLKSEPSARAV